ncbi:beta-galactosidase [Neobacillus jeddahensis]|uniref:beta-galactosidase n=1 Tax=Neobacillus jeddahensis TaxID=1461580 RepID=UPI00058DCA39|nr:beta-galactosidase [Neobacillus jeddahensis]
MEQKIYVGSNYNPEHWPRDRWAEDVRLMKEAGVNIIRLADLAWSKLEPTNGTFDFGWLDDFIEMVSKENVQIVMATPIEGSPVWLRHIHPEVVATDEFGHIHGDRGHHCHNSSTYAFYVDRIVHKMAAHYASNPAIIGWQIDNELRAVPCYCGECAKNYRRWLQERYGSIEKLNEEWGTVFWSQVYNKWEEVQLPTADQLTKSVSQIVDYKRFCSFSTVNYVNRQIGILKSYAPHQFVTHNSLGLYHGLDVYKLGENLDYMGVDLYPDVDEDNINTIMNLDIHRSAKRANFLVLEQKNGYFNYSDYNLAIEPGIVRLWGYQDIARGANAVLFYNWRANRFSWEQNPNGILRHDGSPRRAYYELQQMNQELKGFGEELAGTTVDAPVGIIHSYDHIWAFDAHVQYKNFEYREHIKSYYHALNKMGITSDLIDPRMDLSRYKIVIAPSLMMVSEEIQENLKTFVKNGGCLVIGARSGFKTWANVTIDTPWPGLLSELSGVLVDEFEVLPDKYSNTIFYNGKEYEVKVWLDMLETKSAETLAVYKQKFYAGRTAISKNSYGKGTVYYVGVMGNEELNSDILLDIVKDRNIPYTFLPEGVFATQRKNDQHSFTFYINKSNEAKQVPLVENGLDVISGNQVSDCVTINGLDVLIVKK